MSKTAQSTKNTITLKGSAQIVTEFFGYSINRSGRERNTREENKIKYTADRQEVSLTRSLARSRGSPCVSILFQRGIYEAESFTKVQKYGLGMQVTTDNGLAEYLKKVLTQLQGQPTTSSWPERRACATRTSCFPGGGWLGADACVRLVRLFLVQIGWRRAR